MTNKLFAFLILLFCSKQIFGQYTLDTPDGKQVKLNSNGTWIYVKPEPFLTMSKFGVPANSTAKYTSHLKKFEFWYNPTQWIVDTTKIGNSFTWDAYFYSTDYAIQCFCLDSRLSMPIENFEESVRQQWQSTGEIKVFTSKKDTINNLPLTIYEMEYVQANITYIYKGIVYSDLKGSFQFTAGTQKEIYDEEKAKIDLLLKGLTKK